MAPPKAKGQKMGLGEFLTDSSLGSWADEMEDAPLPSHSGRGFGSSFGGGDRYFSSAGGSGGADRGYAVREALPLPTKPPYTVHLGNMSFDATEGDVHDFFAECEVTNVRIVEDKLDKKPKGFGYVEFATVEGLKKALDLSGSQFQGRNIRISVAEPQKDSGMREITDWTRKGPLPDAGPRRAGGDRPGFGGDRPGFGGDRPGFGGDRPGFGGDRPGYGAPRGFEEGGDRAPRRQFEQGDGKVRDFDNWERKGPLQSAAPAPRQFDRPPSNDGPRERRDSPAWGEGRSQDGSRPPRREFSDRGPPPERVPTAADQDNQWRSKMRPDALAAPAATSPDPSNREPSVPSSPAASHAPLTSRPKLNLQKRTVSTADPSPVTATAADSKSSPFGAARPIDTSAREKEIEEKIRQRKEQEDKAREEKRAADDKAKEERKQAKDAERADKTKTNPNGETKDDEQEEGANKSYQILRRDGEQADANDQGGDGAALDATSDAASKAAGEDAKSANGTAADQPAAEAEDDGWSTVSKPVKGRRGGARNAA